MEEDEKDLLGYRVRCPMRMSFAHKSLGLEKATRRDIVVRLMTSMWCLLIKDSPRVAALVDASGDDRRYPVNCRK